MKKYHFISALSAFFIIISGAYSVGDNSSLAEDLNVKKPTAPVQHRVKIGGFSMRGKKEISGGARKFIFDDVVKFKQDLYENIHFQCGSLEGNGIINAENIKIVADEFSFTGILQYTKNCTIVTPVAVDQTKFSAQGPNAPIFIVDPNLPKFLGGSAFAHFKEQGGMLLSSTMPDSIK